MQTWKVEPLASNPIVNGIHVLPSPPLHLTFSTCHFQRFLSFALSLSHVSLMGGAIAADVGSETALLLGTGTTSAAPDKIPEDPFHLTYITYFILGAGYLLPWNAFITAIDYFSYIYPETRVDRIFAVVYMLVALVCLVFLIFYTHRSDARVRINVGLSLFFLALLVVPVVDVFYIKGQIGLYGGFYVTVVAVALCGVADALVQGGVVGCAGELPERYMQAVVSGTAGSGVLVSALRILTKAAYPQDAHGLRQSANLYFAVGIAFMILCIVMYNVAENFPVTRHYQNLKNEEKEKRGPLFGSIRRSTLWEITNSIKIYGLGLVLIYIVTLSIFPGYITEDVHSEIFKDWYSILLITGYNVFDLVGKTLSAFYLLGNPKVAFGSCVARLLFYPLFLACLHGHQFLGTEIPVAILTCLLGLTNGYFTAVMMILAPKVVRFEYAEIAGVLLVLFLIFGLAAGSVVAWFWVI